MKVGETSLKQHFSFLVVFAIGIMTCFFYNYVYAEVRNDHVVGKYKNDETDHSIYKLGTDWDTNTAKSISVQQLKQYGDLEAFGFSNLPEASRIDHLFLDEFHLGDSTRDTFLLVFYSKPEDGTGHTCRACHVVLSVFEFQFISGHWWLTTEAISMDQAGQWGDPPQISVIEIGDKKYALKTVGNYSNFDTWHGEKTTFFYKPHNTYQSVFSLWTKSNSPIASANTELRDKHHTVIIFNKDTEDGLYSIKLHTKATNDFHANSDSYQKECEHEFSFSGHKYTDSELELAYDSFQEWNPCEWPEGTLEYREANDDDSVIYPAALALIKDQFHEVFSNLDRYHDEHPNAFNYFRKPLSDEIRYIHHFYRKLDFPSKSKDRFLLVFYTAPVLPDDASSEERQKFQLSLDCASCGKKLSFFEFSRENNAWIITSEMINFMEAGSFGNPPEVDLFDIGPEKYALRVKRPHRDLAILRWYGTSYDLFAKRKNTYRNVANIMVEELYLDSGEFPGRLIESNMQYKIGSNEEFYDFLIDYTVYEGTDNKAKVEEKIQQLLVFENDAFRLMP